MALRKLTHEPNLHISHRYSPRMGILCIKGYLMAGSRSLNSMHWMPCSKHLIKRKGWAHISIVGCTMWYTVDVLLYRMSGRGSRWIIDMSCKTHKNQTKQNKHTHVPHAFAFSNLCLGFTSTEYFLCCEKSRVLFKRHFSHIQKVGLYS